MYPHCTHIWMCPLLLKEKWGSTENPGCFCEHLTRFSRKTAEDTPFERRIFLTIAAKPRKMSADTYE